VRRFSSGPDFVAERRRLFRRYLRAALFVGAGGWLLLIGLYLYRFRGGLSARPEDWGVFGDYLGGVLNPILAFASFMVVLVSLYENRIQAADERRARGMETVISTFTGLLERVNDVVRDLRYERTRVTPVGLASAAASVDEVRGREVFRYMFQNAVKTPYAHERGSREAPDLPRYVELMKQLDADWGYELGVYFRLINHLFTFLDMANLPLEERTRLANFARAQLSSYELSLLFYNALWGEGRATFKPLAEKYGLFKHLRAEHVLDARDLVPGALFAEAAFVGFGVSRSGRVRSRCSKRSESSGPPHVKEAAFGLSVRVCRRVGATGARRRAARQGAPARSMSSPISPSSRLASTGLCRIRSESAEAPAASASRISPVSSSAGMRRPIVLRTRSMTRLPVSPSGKWKSEIKMSGSTLRRATASSASVPFENATTL
jgi:putative phage abortive infection protein